MAKTVYITEEQFKNLKESMIKEDEQNGPLEIPITNTSGGTGSNVGKMTPSQMTKAMTDKSKELRGLGIPNGKVEFTVSPQNLVCSKIYTKKQIEEAKIKKIIGNSPKYSKTDFQNRFF